MRHVVHVVARLNVGGPAAILGTLQRHADAGTRHTVLTGDVGAGELAWAALRDDGPTALVVPGLGPAVRPGRDARALAGLVRRLRDLRPDVVHTHTAKGGALGRVAARLVGVPSVHTFHGHVLTGYFSPRTAAAYLGVERRLARRTAALVSVGERVGEELRAAGVGPDRPWHVVAPAATRPSTYDRVDARTTLDLDLRSRVVLVAGRLTAVKRVDRAIAVVRRLLADGHDVQLAVAGGGEDADALQALAADLGDRVRFLGWVGDVGLALSAADLVLLTSDNEGMPVGLVDAALAGVAAVATDVGSVAEVVVDGATGRVVPPDVGALADACAHLLVDDGLRTRLGEEARRRAADRFSPAAMVAAHEAIYESIR